MERSKPFRCRISGLLLAGNSLSLWNLSNLRIVSTSGSGLNQRAWLRRRFGEVGSVSLPIGSAFDGVSSKQRDRHTCRSFFHKANSSDYGFFVGLGNPPGLVVVAGVLVPEG
jgi:hypothetical protein